MPGPYHIPLRSTVPGEPGRLQREPAAVEAADREVTSLRQLLAQGRPVTDADLARVSALIRGEARGAWLGRPPTWEEEMAHVEAHGPDAPFAIVHEDGSVTAKLGPHEPWVDPHCDVVDIAMPSSLDVARELALERAQRP